MLLFVGKRGTPKINGGAEEIHRSTYNSEVVNLNSERKRNTHSFFLN